MAMAGDIDPWIERRETWAKQDDDIRSDYELDLGRVIHSASFRRLQGKTQILSLGDSDFYRTRLTHSLEVAQVGGGILQELDHRYRNSPLQALLPPASLLQAICLVHDLGHPPFGHGGEVALNHCMRDHGGFEGNGQTLRILARLEDFSDRSGANLTRRTLLGTLKYPVAYADARPADWQSGAVATGTGTILLDRKRDKPPKCYLDSERDVVDWLLRPFGETDARWLVEGKRKALDCSIMNLADDISYGVHDLEDAIALGLVDRTRFLDEQDPTLWRSHLDLLRHRFPDEFNGQLSDYATRLFNADGRTKREIGRLIHYFLKHVEIAPQGISGGERLLHHQAALAPDAQMLLDSIQDFVVRHVIMSPGVQHLEFKGQQMVMRVFEALAHDPDHFLPQPFAARIRESEVPLRLVCDHVAELTDQALMRLYDRMFSPRMGSVFDRI